MTDTPVDWTDPCARAAALRKAFYALITGDHEQEIRTRTVDAEETVRFQAADRDALVQELRSAEDECLRRQNPGALPQRFAITLRHKRHGLLPRSSLFRGC